MRLEPLNSAVDGTYGDGSYNSCIYLELSFQKLHLYGRAMRAHTFFMLRRARSATLPSAQTFFIHLLIILLECSIIVKIGYLLRYEH